MACIDDHRNLEAFNKLDGAYDYRRDIIRALRPVLMRFLRKKVSNIKNFISTFICWNK